MREDDPILVVEDDEASAYYLEEIIAEFGIPVLTVATATEAIEILRDNHVCLIFMDIRLPDMDGYELTRKLRMSGIAVPIIAQTAFVLPDDSEKALSSGCDAYLPKPLRKEVLWDTLNKYLHISHPINR